MRIAGIGYAVPGGVIAVGLLFPFAAFDNALDAFMEANFGIDTGLLITGSIWLMIAAYMVRFMAAALNTYDSGAGHREPQHRRGGAHAGQDARCHAARGCTCRSCALDPDRAADRLRRRDEGTARDADPAALQLRHARGAGPPAGLRRTAGRRPRCPAS
jgi:hypothetical protein